MYEFLIEMQLGRNKVHVVLFTYFEKEAFSLHVFEYNSAGTYICIHYYGN